jgi:hypothetical protein
MQPFPALSLDTGFTNPSPQFPFINEQGSGEAPYFIE